MVAFTGRLSANEPSLQNIVVRNAEGHRIREAFIKPSGIVIVSAGYWETELRIMTHISGDPASLKAFAEEEDIYRATAAEIFGVSPMVGISRLNMSLVAETGVGPNWKQAH